MGRVRAIPECQKPSHEFLLRAFEYRQDGSLIWRIRDDMAARWNSRWAGTVAGTVNAYGYRQVSLENKLYRAHHIVWSIHHRSWPLKEIDHINGVRDDNRISNLRVASGSENASNRGVQSNNTSGHIGVSWCGRKGMWRSVVESRGVFHHVGYFETKVDAAAAYREASLKHHGEFSPFLCRPDMVGGNGIA